MCRDPRVYIRMRRPLVTGVVRGYDDAYGIWWHIGEYLAANCIVITYGIKRATQAATTIMFVTPAIKDRRNK